MWPRSKREYFERRPDVGDPTQLVSFGTSGHRGTAARRHLHRSAHPGDHPGHLRLPPRQGIDGPLYMGKDTHALSGPAQRTALEVLAANGVETVIQRDDGVTPTPVISRAILVYNRGRKEHLADGIVDHAVAQSAARTADSNTIRPTAVRPTPTSRNGCRIAPTNCCATARTPTSSACPSLRPSTPPPRTRTISSCPTSRTCGNVIDMDAIRAAGLKLGVDPLGGASLPYWEPINAEYQLDVAVVNPKIDPTFSFMTVDHDGKIRMDCSSPYAMARLVGLKDQLSTSPSATIRTPTGMASSRRRPG